MLNPKSSISFSFFFFSKILQNAMQINTFAKLNEQRLLMVTNKSIMTFCE